MWKTTQGQGLLLNHIVRSWESPFWMHWHVTSCHVLVNWYTNLIGWYWSNVRRSHRYIQLDWFLHSIALTNTNGHRTLFIVSWAQPFTKIAMICFCFRFWWKIGDQKLASHQESKCIVKRCGIMIFSYEHLNSNFLSCSKTHCEFCAVKRSIQGVLSLRKPFQRCFLQKKGLQLPAKVLNMTYLRLQRYFVFLFCCQSNHCCYLRNLFKTIDPHWWELVYYCIFELLRNRKYLNNWFLNEFTDQKHLKLYYKLIHYDSNRCMGRWVVL